MNFQPFFETFYSDICGASSNVFHIEYLTNYSPGLLYLSCKEASEMTCFPFFLFLLFNPNPPIIFQSLMVILPCSDQGLNLVPCIIPGGLLMSLRRYPHISNPILFFKHLHEVLIIFSWFFL